MSRTTEAQHSAVKSSLGPRMPSQAEVEYYRAVAHRMRAAYFAKIYGLALAAVIRILRIGPAAKNSAPRTA